MPLDDLREWLQVEDTSENDLIESIRTAALRRVEGPNGAGLALLDQTWSIHFDVPQGGLHSSWLQALGDPFKAWTKLFKKDLGTPGSAEIPLLTGDGAIEFSYYDDCIRPESLYWPSAFKPATRIRAEYTVGYGTDVTDVPSDLLLAIKMTARQFYDFRDSMVMGAMTELPSGAQAIIADYRRF